MEELSLQQLFGVSAYQDSQVLIVQKSDYSFSGLPTAQAWFAAIIDKARQNFNGYITGNGQYVTSENLNYLDYDNSTLYEGITIFYQRSDLIDKNGVSYKAYKFKILFTPEIVPGFSI
jgi:hypothetical protein